MTRAGLGQLAALEGYQVSLALGNGDRIDDAQLVSARPAPTTSARSTAQFR
jgi:hypothetical protein